MKDKSREQIPFYPEIARVVKELLHIDGSPLVIKFFTKQIQIPLGLAISE